MLLIKVLFNRNFTIAFTAKTDLLYPNFFVLLNQDLRMCNEQQIPASNSFILAISSDCLNGTASST